MGPLSSGGLPRKVSCIDLHQATITSAKPTSDLTDVENKKQLTLLRSLRGIGPTDPIGVVRPGRWSPCTKITTDRILRGDRLSDELGIASPSAVISSSLVTTDPQTSLPACRDGRLANTRTVPLR